MKINEYITLEECKHHLNVDVDFDGDDRLILSQLDSAAQIVCAETCRSIDELIEADGVLNGIARSAILMKLGDLYAYRESVYNGSMSQVPEAYNRLINLIRRWR